MLTYRAVIRPCSASLTPWQADTLFGHLCWLIRYRESEEALLDFLEQYHQGRPPLLLSNGFPGELLPRPTLPAQGHRADLPKSDQIATMKAAKRGKDIRWISLDDFNALRRGERIHPGRQIALKPPQVVLKNQINRLTGGTAAMDEKADSGNLYNLEELRFVDEGDAANAAMDISVYVRVIDQAWAERAKTLFGYLSDSGYGKKKSSGYGHIEIASWEPFDGFDQAVSEPDGFISLSNWVPAPGDPTEGTYQTLVKYGKLGEEFANRENPFKFPLTMLRAGSSFLGNGPRRDWYGRLVEDIAPLSVENPDLNIVQYGYAFAVAAKLGVQP